jgi:nucleolar protein 6
MSTADKLTKKQRKTLVFRERKTGKRKNQNASFMVTHNNDIPAMDDQDMADAQSSPLEVEMEERNEEGNSSPEKGHGKGKEEANDHLVEKSKKRKREGDQITAQKGREKKRAKVLDDVGETAEKKVAKMQRFILFIGMLRLSVTSDLQAHI